MSAEHIEDSQFEAEVLKSDLPVLVDFFAVWCGPCKMAAPVLDQLADQYKGKVKILKIDVDQNETAGKYDVMSIPTIIMFKDGKEVDRMIGFPRDGKAGYEGMIKKVIGG